MTSILVGTETLLLALLSLLVIGLLRSHAEILRRLEGADRQTQLPSPATWVSGAPALDVAGTTPSGDARTFSMRAGSPTTLLAFLSSGCSSCAALLEDLEKGKVAVRDVERLIVVTKDATVEMPSRFRAAARVSHVVMSSQAWDDYAVPGSPYFAYVDGPSGIVAGEGSAPTWARVSSLLIDALEESAPADRDSSSRVELDLAGAGLEPGDPSLYPSRS